MDIREVLTRSWRIIWKHKILWIFGILASCARSSGSGGGGSGGSQSSQIFPELDRLFVANGGGNHLSLYTQNRSISDLNSFFTQISLIDDWAVLLIILGSILLIAILVMLVLSLGVVGQIGVIKGAQEADQDVDKLHFSALLVEVKKYFWRVFGLSLVAGLFVFLVMVVIILFVMIITVMTLGLGLLCLIPIIFLLLPVLWGFAVILKQAIISIVVEDQSLSSAIQVGWKLFWSNLREMIPLTLILDLGLTLIVGILLVIPMLLIFVPSLIGFMINTTESTWIGLSISLLAGLIYLPMLILLTGILRTYTLTAWTLTFLRLRSNINGVSSVPVIIEEES
jgi:hypothetical protein